MCRTPPQRLGSCRPVGAVPLWPKACCGLTRQALCRKACPSRLPLWLRKLPEQSPSINRLTARTDTSARECAGWRSERVALGRSQICRSNAPMAWKRIKSFCIAKPMQKLCWTEPAQGLRRSLWNFEVKARKSARGWPGDRTGSSCRMLLAAAAEPRRRTGKGFIGGR